MNKNNPVKSAEQDPQSLAYELYAWLREIVGCISVITVVFVFFVRLVSVSGMSMYPTLENNDKVVLLSNFLSQNYRQGDIVVLMQENYKDEPLIKRVIATEGQTVWIDYDAGVVYVDGEPLDEDYTAAPTYNRGTLQMPVQVPENCIFVLGDNRNESADSRFAEIGMIDKRQVMGKVLCILFPFSHAGRPEMGIWEQEGT